MANSPLLTRHILGVGGVGANKALPGNRQKCAATLHRWLQVLLLVSMTSACADGGGGDRGDPVPNERVPAVQSLCNATMDSASVSFQGQMPSEGCVVTYTQTVTDTQFIDQYGVDQLMRRYIVYAPSTLPPTPVPVVFAFHGADTEAETFAWVLTHRRFEILAQQENFVVVYANAWPEAPTTDFVHASMFRSCLDPHDGEMVDVQYTREILDQLQSVGLNIDRRRIYATGISSGGGMALMLALEAPDLVAGVAPAVPLPFSPTLWLGECNLHPDHGSVPIAMLAATADTWISYEPGEAPRFPGGYYPGMEETRDSWLGAMGITGEATMENVPDVILGDSLVLESSYIELYKYPLGPQGQEFWYYKAVGMGHWWPNPVQMWGGLWSDFGKTNQDIDFADEAWAFFKRHEKHWSYLP